MSYLLTAADSISISGSFWKSARPENIYEKLGQSYATHEHPVEWLFGELQ